jgi:hypothetical protein
MKNPKPLEFQAEHSDGERNSENSALLILRAPKF